jgi:hypothetical protein
MYLIKLAPLDPLYVLPNYNAVTTLLTFAICPFVPLDSYISVHLHLHTLYSLPSVSHIQSFIFANTSLPTAAQPTSEARLPSPDYQIIHVT